MKIPVKNLAVIAFKKCFFCGTFLLLLLTLIGYADQVSGRSFSRGMLVSVIQNPPVLSNTAAISQLVSFSKKSGIQIIFVQVYYANKTWFPSHVGDTTPYDECLKNVGEDPLALLISKAHAAGIEVHAWLNLLSLNDNADSPLLKKYGPSILTQDRKEKQALEDYKIDKQYFLEPGDLRVRSELLTMVEEMVRTYPDLDGILFDYIRYPDFHPIYGHTPMNVRRFQQAAGLSVVEDFNPQWQDWKRGQVTEFLQMLVQKVRSIRPSIQVSATACMPYARAFHEASQDWPAWLDHGIVDFVTLMAYSPDPAEFQQWSRQAKTKTIHWSRVNLGIGAYKLVRSPEIFAKELEFCEKAEGGACVIFHYGSLLENSELAQVLALSEPNK